jgi:hypothetical protein
MYKPHSLLASHIFCQHNDDFAASRMFTDTSKEHTSISTHTNRFHSGELCECYQDTVMYVFLDTDGIAHVPGSTRETLNTPHLPLQRGAGERSQQYGNSTKLNAQKLMNSSKLPGSTPSASIIGLKRYEKSHAERSDSGFHPRKLLNLFVETTEKNVYGLLQSCEQTLCLIPGLEKVCAAPNQHSEEIGKTCKMWYLSRNNGLTHADCITRSKQEIKNLVLQLAVSIVITAVVGLILLRNNSRARPQEQNNTSTQNAESLKYQASWRNPQMHGLLQKQSSGSERGMCDLGPEEKSGKPVNNSFTFRQRWKLDLMARVPRRNIKDLFDLESLGSRKDPRSEEEGVSERIPVLPRAHNASVRLPGCIHPSFKGPRTTDNHVGGNPTTIINNLTNSSPRRRCLPENNHTIQ